MRIPALFVALLVAAGYMGHDVELSLTDGRTLWIILSCHLAMGLNDRHRLATPAHRLRVATLAT